jgi:hypothetical protein
MKIEGTHLFQAPEGRVWELLTTPQHLEKALPGCERLLEREPGKYDAVLKIGIAAIKGSYTGKVEIADPEPPRRYRLVGEGSGAPGFVRGEALIELSPQGQATLVRYQGDMQVGGLIAGIGQRMMGGVAKMMLGQFFKNLEKLAKG